MKRLKRLTREEKKKKFKTIAAWLQNKRKQAARNLNDEFKN